MRRFIVLFFVLASRVLAQDSSGITWTTHVLKSAKLGESRTIRVVTPPGYGDGDARYPVLVLLDGNDGPQLRAAVANLGFLSSRNEIPALIVVGVENGKDRTRDMTPTAKGATAKQFPTAGGVAAFTSFITDEVLPSVRSKYRTLPGTILAGHSFGGLVALHVAAAKPGVFNGIIAMSPSLWWNDSAAALGYADSIAKASGTPRLFVTSGGLEPDIDVTTTRFATRLNSVKPPSLAFARRRYPDDDHGLTPAPSLVDGMRFIFEPLSLTKAPVLAIRKADSATLVNAVVATEQNYARAARGLGLPEQLPETFVNTIGYAALRELKLPGVAAWIFRKNVVNHPNSANVYDSMGDALLAGGDSNGAKSQFQRAIDVAVRTKAPVDPDTRRKLAELERKRGR